MKKALSLLVWSVCFVGMTGSSAFSREEFGESVSDRPKVIYGEDNRLDYYQVTDPALRMLADSTAVLVPVSDLEDTGSGFRFTSTSRLSDKNVCPEEPFYDQPTPGFCSAFLVSEDMAVTAGHCLNAFNVTNIAFVFGFRMESPDTPVTEFSYDQVYFGSELVDREGSTCVNDWSLVRLDRPVIGLSPLAVRMEGKIPDGQDLVVIGYPVGLPVKISGGASVRSNIGFRTFVANLDTYQGNSGSAVFNADTLEVEGVLVCGDSDFVYDSDRGCRQSNRCPDDGCRGEDCTRATEWSNLLPKDPCEQSGRLTFLSPKREDSLIRGGRTEIAWFSEGRVGESLDLLLFRGDYFAGVSWTDLTNICGATNHAVITLPEDLESGSGYRFRLHNGGEGDFFVGDFSDYFSVVQDSTGEEPSLTIQSPGSAENGIVGGLFEVSWTSIGEVGEELRLLLFRGEPTDLTWQFVDVRVGNRVGTNSYVWTIPLGLEPGNDYRIRLLSPSTGVSRLSEAFSIVEPEGIHITAPDRLTRGLIGQPLEIRWTSDTDLGGEVELLFFAGQAPVWQGVRISGIPNHAGENEYLWEIPASLLDSIVPGTPFYSVKIFRDEVHNDFSDLFSIDRVPTGIEIVRPDGTETAREGEPFLVEWTSQGEVRSDLRLILFREIDGNLFWQFVSEPLINEEGTNRFLWTVPNGLGGASGYRIKVYDPMDESLFDLSEPFTIESSSKKKWGPVELIEWLRVRRMEESKRDPSMGEDWIPLRWNP